MARFKRGDVIKCVGKNAIEGWQAQVIGITGTHYKFLSTYPSPYVPTMNPQWDSTLKGYIETVKIESEDQYVLELDIVFNNDVQELLNEKENA